MNCQDARVHLRDFGRGRLDAAAQEDVAAHLQACTSCTAAQRAEDVLDRILAQQLPRHAAPEALRRRLAMIVGAAEEPSTTLATSTAEAPRPTNGSRIARRAGRRWTRLLAPALAASIAVMSAGVLWHARGTRTGVDALTSELVNDHLRVLVSQHPLDLESSATHQVKPWFEGKLDFAPDVPLAEGTDLRLRGGSVGYVFDRKAAVVVYALRRHAVTLLVTRAEGLPWPDRAAGAPRTRETATRGFHVVSWRSGDLGYALVSDVNAAELAQLGARLARDTASPPSP